MKHETIVLADGFRVGVSTVGTGAPLVFLHGLSVSAKAYEEMLTRLAEHGFRVIALDAANHGRSGSLPTGHTVEDMTRVTLKTLDELDIHRAIFAGHSMGGRHGGRNRGASPAQSRGSGPAGRGCWPGTPRQHQGGPLRHAGVPSCQEARGGRDRHRRRRLRGHAPARYRREAELPWNAAGFGVRAQVRSRCVRADEGRHDTAAARDVPPRRTDRRAPRAA
ncbi:alpha/beta fold hydrolase [Paraburkholderia bengalensis]|uniref:alpha/beta fold hydrolase n=1 Tax=Paraburkholderia bengalensis TaxID=2747562 RepID=UPI003AF9B728